MSPSKQLIQDEDFTLYVGDALETLRTLPSESVHMCVTSPPYWGLRDYGTGSWEGGDEGCEHKRPRSRRDGAGRERPDLPNPPASWAERDSRVTEAFVECECGARRVDNQLGLEPTPEAYVARMVEAFREVRRVLRRDGTLFLNLGDSHANKQLQGAPWKVAFALQADGWCLRSDVIWSKPNPMPESVTDRPTKAHEYLFLLTPCQWVGAIEPWPITREDAIWLAALVDGEGTICFQERANNEWAPHVGPRLSIVNTNRALLERISEITNIGEGTTPSPRTRNDGSEGRPIFTWQVTNEKAARIIDAIRPHLIAKQVQAELAIYVHTLNQKHKGRGGHRTTDVDLVLKRKAAAACSNLNHGRDVDLGWFKPVRPGRWVTPKATFYDADAIREPAEWARWGDQTNGKHEGSGSAAGWIGANPKKALTSRRSPLIPEQTKQGVGRQGRDSDTFGLSADGRGRNKRTVWEIATEPFSDWGQSVRQRRVEPDAPDDGKKRTTSPDCPVHGDLPVPAPTAADDEHGDGLSSRTERTDAGHGQVQLDERAPTDQRRAQGSSRGSSDSLAPVDSSPATSRSTGTHKTASRSTSRGTASSETSSRTEGTLPSNESPEPDDSGSHDSSGTSDHSLCTCTWYVEYTERTSHFATFPQALVEPCILAGTSERGCCPECGAPWERETEVEQERLSGSKGRATQKINDHNWDGVQARTVKHVTTLGWHPTCDCWKADHPGGPYGQGYPPPRVEPIVPCTVLDPFMGSGTTALVARRLGRRTIGIELSPEYAELAARRLQQLSLLA